MSAPVASTSVAEIAALVLEAPPGVGPSREAIAAAVALIAERFRPERIVLFGSRAYGVPTGESDVDLMVVMDDPDRSAVLAALPPSDARFDVHVRTPGRVRLGLSERDFFLLDVMDRGVALHQGRVGVGRVQGRTPDDETGALGPSALKHSTREWLRLGESTYRMIRLIAEPPDRFAANVRAHAARAVGAYLKAFLQEREIRAPRTDDLGVLVELAVTAEPALVARRPDLAWLSDHDVDIGRPYPRDATPAEAERALRIAVDLRRTVRAALEVDGEDGGEGGRRALVIGGRRGWAREDGVGAAGCCRRRRPPAARP